MNRMHYTYTAVFEKCEEGGYFVHCPALLGCVAQGETRQEARDNIGSALRVYIDSCLERNITLTKDCEVNLELSSEKISVTL